MIAGDRNCRGESDARTSCKATVFAVHGHSDMSLANKSGKRRKIAESNISQTNSAADVRDPQHRGVLPDLSRRRITAISSHAADQRLVGQRKTDNRLLTRSGVSTASIDPPPLRAPFDEMARHGLSAVFLERTHHVHSASRVDDEHDEPAATGPGDLACFGPRIQPFGNS